MTIIAVAKYKDNVVISSDSNFEDEYIKAQNLVHRSKIIKFAGIAVGYCGSAFMGTILRKLAIDKEFLKNDWIEMKDFTDALSFAEEVFNDAKEVSKKRLMSESTSDKELEGTELLIAAKSGIYSVEDSLEVTDYHNFYMVGSGKEVAMGAMHVLYPKIKGMETLREAVETSVAVACKYAVGCGLPINTIVLGE